MKKLFIVLLAAVSLPAFAQKLAPGKVPAPANTTFSKSYPAVKDVKWEKEKGNYEATFMQGGAKTSVVYNDKGEWIETETVMDASRVVPSISKYVAEHYAGKTIKEVSRIDKPNSTVNYEVEVNGQDLLFGPNGQFIKAVVAE